MKKMLLFTAISKKMLLFTAISKKIKKITKNVIFLLTFIVYCGIIIYIESEGYNVRNY